MADIKYGPDTKLETAYKDTFAKTPDVNTAYEQTFNPPVATPEAATQPADAAQPAEAMPDQVNVINPEGALVSLPAHQVADAVKDGYRIATPEDVAEHEKQEKYGTPGQQALAGLEAAGRAFTFGVSTPIEIATGLTTPEAIRGREEVNPGTATLGEIGGFGASLLTGVGEAALLERAGVGAARMAGLGGKGASFLSKVGSDAIRGAVETGLMQGGDELHKAFIEDPEKVAETAITDIGLASVMGGVFGGALGAGLRKLGVKLEPVEAEKFVDPISEQKLAQGDIATHVQLDPNLKEPQKMKLLDVLKPSKYKEQIENAGEVKDALARAGVEAPPAFLNKSPMVKSYVHDLLEGPRTAMGQGIREGYEAVHKGATNLAEGVVKPSIEMTKAQLGTEIGDQFVSLVRAEDDAMRPAFDQLKSITSELPLKERLMPMLKKELEEMPEMKELMHTDAGQVIKKIHASLDEVKSLDGLNRFRSSLGGFMSGFKTAPERRAVAIVADKLKSIEANSIREGLRNLVGEDAAKTFQKEMDMVRSTYAEKITPVKQLAQKLGMRSEGGFATIANFVQDLAERPEAIAERLSRKEDSEFRTFFNKAFPELAQKFNQYEKTNLYAKATKNGLEAFDPKRAIQEVAKISPEIQKTMFSAEELKNLKAAHTLFEQLPETYHPARFTANAHPSLLGHFKKEGEHFIANKFINMVSKSPELKQASMLAKASSNGWNATKRAAKAVMDPEKSRFPAGIVVNMANRAKLDKMVESYAKDPQRMVAIGDNNPSPEYGGSFAQTSARAVQYLNSIKPNKDPASPLDPKPVVSKAAQAEYDRQLDLAQNPALILKHMHDGTLTPKDMVTVQTIYPKYFGQIQTELTNNMHEMIESGKTVPYKTRQFMSMMLTQPLDSTMTPASIQSAQMVHQMVIAQQGQDAGKVNTPRGRPSAPSLNKLSTNYQTKGQAAEAAALKK